MTTTCRLILLLLMAIGIQEVYSNTHSVLERYEERLNSALSKRTGVPRTVKRYKCVEEYVTYDQHGRQVTSYQGPKFTTTMEPPTYRTSGEKEIRRKPAKKVTIAINRESEPTTQKPVTSSTESNQPTSSLKPFDEMNDEEADRIIEEMYLKKKESHATESPEELPEVIRTESTQPPLPPPPPPPQKTHAYSTSSSSANNGVGLPPSRYSTVKQQRNNRIRETEDDEDYPRSVYHRDSRKRPYDMSTYDDYDDIPLYRPMRREYRMRRRRPIMFSDDFSDDTDFDERIESNPRRQTTRDLSPLRSIKSLRHLPPQYRQPGPPPPAPLSLPVSSSKYDPSTSTPPNGSSSHENASSTTRTSSNDANASRIGSSSNDATSTTPSTTSTATKYKSWRARSAKNEADSASESTRNASGDGGELCENYKVGEEFQY